VAVSACGLCRWIPYELLRRCFPKHLPRINHREQREKSTESSVLPPKWREGHGMEQFTEKIMEYVRTTYDDDDRTEELLKRMDAVKDEIAAVKDGLSEELAKGLAEMRLHLDRVAHTDAREKQAAETQTHELSGGEQQQVRQLTDEAAALGAAVKTSIPLDEKMRTGGDADAGPSTASPSTDDDSLLSSAADHHACAAAPVASAAPSGGMKTESDPDMRT
jgi:hypothetical protein